jgi:hypothetical protein
MLHTTLVEGVVSVLSVSCKQLVMNKEMKKLKQKIKKKEELRLKKLEEARANYPNAIDRILVIKEK